MGCVGNRNINKIALAVLAIFALGGVAFQFADAKLGKRQTKTVAPQFSGKASDGKTYSLKTLQATKKPTLLYFIGHTCPINADAVKYYNSIANAYKGKLNFVGVIDTDAAGYAAWQKKFKGPYPVIFDPDLKIIKAFEAERSPWTILVGADGKIIEEWHGYSTGYLNETNSVLAKSTKMKAPKIDVAGAPEQPRYG